MQTVCRITPRVQMIIQFINHDLGAAENDAEAEIVQINEARQQLNLGAPIDFKINLFHLRGILRERFNPNPLRLPRVALDQFLNHARHRRREE